MATPKKVLIFAIAILILATTIILILPSQIFSQEPLIIYDIGFTENGNSLPGSAAGGYLLCTNGDASKEYLLYYKDADLANQNLADDYFPLFLVSSTVSSTALKAYYDSRGTPEPFLTYLKDAVDGNNPFAYIKGDGISRQGQLVDAARHDILSEDRPMAIPGDYPEGTYVVQTDAEGQVTSTTDEKASVAYTLIISRCVPGAKAESVWVRKLPMTCYKVWVNDAGCFKFVFFWEYKNNNWVKIYDMDGNEVFSINMRYGNPRFEACLDDGIYTVKTFHNDMKNPIQEFLIGKP